MDEVMSNNQLSTNTEERKGNFKSIGVKLLVVSLILVAVAASIPYGYAFYQKSITAKYSQVDIQKDLDKLLTVADTVQYSWMRTLNPKAKEVEGGIVWSQEKQTGIMKFKNLPAISKQEQYHLLLHDRGVDQPISSIRFRQNSFDPNTRLVPFKPEKTVKSPYKFILLVENLANNKEDEILLRVQP